MRWPKIGTRITWGNFDNPRQESGEVIDAKFLIDITKPHIKKILCVKDDGSLVIVHMPRFDNYVHSVWNDNREEY